MDAWEARVGWSHEFKEAGTTTARLAGDISGTGLLISGRDEPRDSAVLGLGLMTEPKPHLRFFADIDAELNDTQRSYSLAAGLRYQW